MTFSDWIQRVIDNTCHDFGQMTVAELQALCEIANPCDGRPPRLHSLRGALRHLGYDVHDDKVAISPRSLGYYVREAPDATLEVDDLISSLRHGPERRYVAYLIRDIAVYGALPGYTLH